MSIKIERQLYEFKGENNLILPFRSKVEYSLKNMIYLTWYCFRVESEDMRKLYPKNLDIAVNYLERNKIDSKTQTKSNVYESIEKIFRKYIVDQPKKYVSIRFVSDQEYVYLVKKGENFQIISATLNQSSEISKIFKEGSFKDCKEGEDCIFVMSTTVYYDEIDELDLVELV